MPVTASDIAHRLGLSQMTVSRALAGRGRISDATRNRVIKVAKELGYRPDWRAKALRNQRTRTIGLLYQRSAPYHSALHLVAALAEALAERDHDLTLIPTLGDPDHWSMKLRDRRVDGCLVVDPAPPALGQALSGSHLPAVLINLDLPLPLPRVLLDDADGARQVARHLHELGHRRIAFLQNPEDDPQHYSMAARRQTLQSEWAKAADTAGGGMSVFIESPQAFAARWAANRDLATAVVAYSDKIARELIVQLWERGVRLPQELSIVGFNDDRDSAYATPPLTTVGVSRGEVARAAVDLLLARIESQQDVAAVVEEEPATVVVSPRLIVRASTVAPASSRF